MLEPPAPKREPPPQSADEAGMVVARMRTSRRRRSHAILGGVRRAFRGNVQRNRQSCA
jgi:hypothetical protein